VISGARVVRAGVAGEGAHVLPPGRARARPDDGCRAPPARAGQGVGRLGGGQARGAEESGQDEEPWESPMHPVPQKANGLKAGSGVIRTAGKGTCTWRRTGSIASHTFPRNRSEEHTSELQSRENLV